MDNIAPGILEKSWEEIERKIQIATGFSQTIHIDLIDQSFGEPNFNDPTPFKKYTKEYFFELHMMVSEPLNYLESWADAGFRRFIGHIENMSSEEEFIARGQILGEVGLAVDGKTSIEDIQVSLSDLDVLLVMTIEAGASGRSFIPGCLDKIKKAKQLEKFLRVEVDGGIDDQTIIQAKNAGAERFVTTTYLFNSEDPKAQFEKLKGLV
ncbi:MAG: Ribulose-phosphate 3-epimerase [Candidatus Levybacteria bacterium GW2011_GWA2_40_8]|nr:MAG: Ribulose-phosphate 3-epimerase [Candidatus Levybacteria bacterium GW2011_GWA2_40_8]